MTGEPCELVMIAEAVVEVTLMSVEKDSQYPFPGRIVNEGVVTMAVVESMTARWT